MTSLKFSVQEGMRVQQFLDRTAALKAGYTRGIDDATQLFLQWLAEGQDTVAVSPEEPPPAV